MVKIYLLMMAGALLATSCKAKKDTFVKDNVSFACRQTNYLLKNTGEPTGKNYPRTINKETGELRGTNMYDWTSGFFPGTLWYLYELTGDSYWKEEAAKWTETLEPLKTFTDHHDLGFMMYCSFGNAERLAPKKEYDSILVESAYSLTTRYNENANVIKSWNYRKSWDEADEWFYPVIIDNMMNLELLFYASRITGDRKLYSMAVNHAESTLKNHFRDDFSTYHVINYDAETGEVLNKATNQGYSDNSTWSRGQAWAVYGFTMMYRETKDPRYLDAATKAADFFLNHLDADDLMPAWDFNVGQEGYTPEGKSYAVTFKEKKKDASAGAIFCSALFELAQYAKEKNYMEYAVNILHQLASPEYRAQPETNGGFLLMHSVGSIPHKVEIDVSLVYADYYFLEALLRYRNTQIAR